MRALRAGRGDRDPPVALPEVRCGVFGTQKRSQDVDVLDLSPLLDGDLLGDALATVAVDVEVDSVGAVRGVRERF